MAGTTEHFFVRKVAKKDIPFKGLNVPLYEIYYIQGNEPEACSSEHIADELEICGTHMRRYNKVMKLISGNCDDGVLNYIYYVDDRLFTDPYFLREEDCKKTVALLNYMYRLMQIEKEHKAKRGV